MLHLKDLANHSAEKYGSCIALQMKRGGFYRKWTYHQVKRNVDAFAYYLRFIGIKKGDRVAILGENRPEWAVSYLAILALGAIVVPIDVRLKREEILPLLDDCQAKAIISSDQAREKVGSKLLEKELNMENVLNLKVAVVPHPIEVSEDDVAVILYTSGTTGNPKGVMLTDKNIMSNLINVIKIHHGGPGDNFLSVLPLHHQFETLCGFLAPFYMGCTITYAESLKSHSLLANMTETRVTVMCAVPLLFQLLHEGIMREVEEKGKVIEQIFKLLLFTAKHIPWLRYRRKLFPMIYKKFGKRLRYWICGGAPIDPKIIEFFRIIGIQITQGYGLTETSPIVSCNGERKNKIGTVGRPLAGVEVKIGEGEEILVRGHNVMKGYYKRPDLTAEVIKDGWFHTGDMGTINSQGYLTVTGRIKDLIVTGAGKNVFPNELEFEISKIEGVKEAAVIGSKIKYGSRAGNEEVWAVIMPDFEYFEKQKISQPQEIEKLTRSRIIDLNKNLADYKRISKVIIRRTEFPKTTTRKIKKFQLKKEMGLV